VAFARLLDRFVRLVAALVRLTCITLAAALFIIIIVAVVARYGFDHAISWSEEVPRYLLVWISFLAGASCVLRHEHVGFDVLFNALPRRSRRMLGIFLNTLILLFGWVVFRYGIDFVRDFGSDLMETIPHTNYWYYTAMPVSGFLIMLFSFKHIVDELIGINAEAVAGTGKIVD
jgi:TRAP-type C4-dicarboxylate transport system permease small subunit